MELHLSFVVGLIRAAKMIPMAGDLIRRAMEHRLDITVLPDFESAAPMVETVFGPRPFIYTRFRLRILNHRGDSSLRIHDGRCELRSPGQFGRMQTVATLRTMIEPGRKAVEFDAPALSGPHEVLIHAEAPLNIKAIPYGADLVMVLDTIGGAGSIERSVKRW